MKSFSKLLVRELQAELTAREIAYKPKDKKAILQKVRTNNRFVTVVTLNKATPHKSKLPYLLK